jgi:hypothetical protein
MFVGMDIKKLPSWLISGVIIFSVLIVLGVILFIFTFGKISVLFWLIIPSIFFEEIFETCCYAFSNSYVFNFLFALFFWFTIGAVLGWTTDRIKK